MFVLKFIKVGNQLPQARIQYLQEKPAEDVNGYVIKIKVLKRKIDQENTAMLLAEAMDNRLSLMFDFSKQGSKRLFKDCFIEYVAVMQIEES